MDDYVPLSAFYPAVVGRLPSIAPQHIDYQVMAHVIRAATATGQLRRQIKVDAQNKVAEYPILISDDETLVEVVSVCVNGRKYAPTREKPCEPVIPTPQQINECCPSKCSEQLPPPAWTEVYYSNSVCHSGGNSGTFYISDDGSSVVVNPPPAMDTDDGISIEVSIAPSRLSCRVPKEFWEQWADDIANGASSVLKTYQSKEKSFSEAQYLKKEWVEGLRRMKTARERRYVSMTEKMPMNVRLF